MKKKKIIELLLLIIFIIYFVIDLNDQKINNQLPILPIEPEVEVKDINYIEKNTDDKNLKEKINNIFSKDIDIELTKKDFKNNDIVARLEIPGLFNIILTQSDNNEFYLNHDIRRKKDIKGTEYIDYRNNIYDKQINIYGHNSKVYNLPFRKLEKFLDVDFFNNNKYLLFQTDEERKIYKIVCFKKTGSDYSHMDLNPSNRFEHITKLITNAINARYHEYNENSNIIVLQTCVENSEGNYYILVGFEI